MKIHTQTDTYTHTLSKLVLLIWTKSVNTLDNIYHLPLALGILTREKDGFYSQSAGPELWIHLFSARENQVTLTFPGDDDKNKGDNVLSERGLYVEVFVLACDERWSSLWEKVNFYFVYFFALTQSYPVPEVPQGNCCKWELDFFVEELTGI